MNSTSLLNLSFWEKVVSIFDILPKTIYFLYACLASAVDAMQSLIRKLAGLDTYFRADTGAAVTKTDPLTEFVYGILGFGENSSIYNALNTVFWSLAIFGLIVLVVTTMVAIIKSHYNEDTAQTNPWKYIYTAIKALLTFVIMPIIVIVGLQLTSFVLKTLDNINGPYGHPYSGRPIINKTQPSNDILEQLPDDNNELLNLVKTINEDGAGLNKAQTLMESSLLQGADLSNDNITHNLSEQLVDSSDAHYPILEQISDVIKNILNLD